MRFFSFSSNSTGIVQLNSLGTKGVRMDPLDKNRQYHVNGRKVSTKILLYAGLYVLSK